MSDQNVIMLPDDRIQEVTAEGLRYLDDDGVSQFIDFAACYQNRVARRLDPEALKQFQAMNRIPDEQMPKEIERIKARHEVAARSIIGDYVAKPHDPRPYIEFHSTPCTLHF